MSGFDSFFGNERLISRIKSDISRGKFPVSSIFEGARGCGKRTLAHLVAAALSCDSDDAPCMECLMCDKIMRDISPDVKWVVAESGKVQLGVDVIRGVREDAYYAANDLRAKFYIFPAADTMNIQAQNALLKILEEPPDNVYFLLLCEDADSLLPTIRSRAPRFRLELLPDELIFEKVVLTSPEAAKLRRDDEAAFNAAIKLAGGSLGQAQGFCDPIRAKDCLSAWRAAERFITLLATKRTAADELEFFECATRLVSSKQRDTLSEIYTLILTAVRDMLLSKLARDFRPLFYATCDKAREAASRFPTTRLMSLSELLPEQISDLDRNINLELSMTLTATRAASAPRR